MSDIRHRTGDGKTPGHSLEDVEVRTLPLADRRGRQEELQRRRPHLPPGIFTLLDEMCRANPAERPVDMQMVKSRLHIIQSEHFSANPGLREAREAWHHARGQQIEARNQHAHVW